MPATARRPGVENVPELARLFPPPLRAWLVERGCDDAHWVAPGEPVPARERRSSVDFDVDMGSAPTRWLVLRLHFAEGQALAADEVRAVAAYLAALGPFLQAAVPPVRDPWLTLSRETLLVVEHQLRNHLNSLLMNAAVLSLRSGAPESDPTLEQMENDGRRCLDVVQQLLHPPTPG